MDKTDKEIVKVANKEAEATNDKKLEAMPYKEEHNVFNQSKEQQFEIAKKLFENDLAPSSFKSPQSVLLAMQVAMSFGLKQFGQIYKYLSQMMIINNNVTLFGDLPLSLVMETGQLSYLDEYFLDKDQKKICEMNKNLDAIPHHAVCIASRKGCEKRDFFVSKKDLELSGGRMNENGSWDFKTGGKQSFPWKNHPKRMWRRRCRKYMINDLFPDALLGAKVYETDDNRQFVDVNKPSDTKVESDFKNDFQADMDKQSVKVKNE